MDLCKTATYLQTLHLQSCDLLDVFGENHLFPPGQDDLPEDPVICQQSGGVPQADQMLSFPLQRPAHMDDMRILYKYLKTSLFPRHSEPELAGRDYPLRPEVARNLLHYGRQVLKHPLWSPASLPPSRSPG
uniref:Uncharacterized protein n=1 Tax=Oncorhynchus tshawytscha TaxID=74940 RepID=A0AAZ3SKG1_ONCTS